MRKITSLVCCAILLLGPARASDLFEIGPQTIAAGGGLGDGGAALAASLLPRALLAGPDGVLYIADEQHNVVRLVGADGTVETVVGNGLFGLDEEERAASESRLAVPAGLALSPDGRLHLVDLGNQQVRVVERDGTLRTLIEAHSPLVNAPPRTFFAPVDIAFDGDGRLYVADRGNHTVWQIDPDGSGRPAAGNGERGFAGDGRPSALAQLDDPRSVVVGADYSIYIADTGNHRVRVVDPDGRIHTLAGDGGQERWTENRRPALAASISPVDLALDASGHLLVLDALGPSLLRLENGGQLAVVERFDEDAEPLSVGVDAQGRILVAARGGRQVLRVGGDQAALPVAGNGRIRASGDGGMASNASLFVPMGLVYDKVGNLYIADQRNHLVRRVRPDGTMETVAGTGRAGFAGDGGDALRAELDRPSGLALDAAGNLYIVDAGNHRVRRVRGDGVIATMAGDGEAGFAGDEGPGWAARLSAPAALAFDGTGNLYIADSGNGRIRRLRADGTIETVAGDGGDNATGAGGPARQTTLALPVDLALARNGDLLIADAGTHRIYRLTDGALLRPVAGSATGAGRGADGSAAVTAALNIPNGIAVDGAGGLYIADSGNGRLLHVDGSGVLRLLAEEVGVPTRLAVDAAGALVFSEVQQHRVGVLALRQLWATPEQRIDVAGNYVVETVAALRQEGLQEVVCDAGELYVTYHTGVDRLVDGGERRAFAEFQGHAYSTVVAPSFLGRGLLLGTPTFGEIYQPLILLWPDGEGKPLFRILPQRFAGSDALSADEDLVLHQRDGRVLRLGRDGELTVLAALEAGRAQVQIGPDGVLFVALETSGALYRGRDEDGDGTMNGPAELRRIATLPAAVVDLVYRDGLFIAAADQRIYRLTGQGQVEVFAEGFAPALLDMSVDSQGAFYILEGDGHSGRILRLSPPQAVLAAWPPALDFGVLALGQRTMRSLILRNEGTLPVQLQQEENPLVYVAGAGAVRLEAGETREFEVHIDTFAPGKTAETLVWRDADSGAILLHLPVSIEGLAPFLSAAADGFDFGIVEVDARASRILRLHNTGDAPLEVRDLEVEAPFIVELEGEEVLEPGAEALVHVHMEPEEQRAFETVLIIHSNDAEMPLREIALRGIGGRAELADLPDLYELGVVLVGEAERHFLELRNVGDVVLRIDQLETGTRHLLVKPRSLEVAPGEEGLVELIFRPRQHGSVEGELTFTSNDPTLSAVRLPFAGGGVSALLQVGATAHVFAATPVGEQVVWDVELENLSRQTVELLQVETNNRQFDIISRPQRLAPGEKGRVRLAYRPTRSGKTRGVLSLSTDLAEARLVEIDLQGLSPVSTALSFGAIAAGRLEPGAALSLPIYIEAAEQLSGVVLTLELPELDVEFVDFEFPAGSLLAGDEAPLMLVDRPRSGVIELGISLTGESGREGIDGSGLFGILHLRLERAVVERREVNISRILLRSVGGSVDALQQSTTLELELELTGDFDGDGRLALSDLFVLMQRLGRQVEAEDQKLDLTEDGQIDVADIAAWYVLFRPVSEVLDTP